MRRAILLMLVVFGKFAIYWAIRWDKVNKSETNMHEEKQFRIWINLKESLHNMNRLRAIHEGDIWWCALGENIGVEINGKNEVFSRPVLIFRKLSRYGFMGVPLTSQLHTGDWYVPFIFKGKTEVAALAQARVMSVARLYKRMGTIPDSDFVTIRQGFAKLYLGEL